MSSSEHDKQKPNTHKGIVLTLTLSLTGIVKGQPLNIAMFGIKSKFLMSTLTVDDLFGSHRQSLPNPKGVIKGQPLNIAVFGINLKVLIRTYTCINLIESCSPPVPTIAP